MSLKVTHNSEHGLSYIYLLGRKTPPGGAKRQIQASPNIILDLDEEGHLIGIELLQKGLLHPALKAIATEITP